MEVKEKTMNDGFKKVVNEEIKTYISNLYSDRIDGLKESDSQIEITKALIAFHLDIESIPRIIQTHFSGLNMQTLIQFLKQ